MLHHSHLRFAAVVGAACGLLYAGITILPAYLSGCYHLDGAPGLCEIGPVIFNLPSAFVLMRILGGLVDEGASFHPGFLAIANAVIFAIVNVVVVGVLRRSNWKILTTTNLLLSGSFFTLPFVILRIF